FTSRGALQSSPQGCVVDLGTKESPGRERRTLRVANLGVETLVLAIQDSPSWLTARWLDGGGEAVHLSPRGRGAELDLLAEHDGLEETTFLGSIPLLAETLTGEISRFEILVRLTTRQTRPFGRYHFQGLEEPRLCDFGLLDLAASGAESFPSYVLSFENMTSVPLVASFADLPDWLVFEVDGYQRRGPAAGRFFGRAAPFQGGVRPILPPPFQG